MAEKKKIAAFKREFYDENSRTFPEGKQFDKPKKYTNRCSELTREMVRLACKRQGWTKTALAFYLRMGKSDSTFNHTKDVLGNGDMRRIRYDRFIAIAGKAGISKEIAVVLWAKALIPNECAADRKHIGLTAPGIRKIKDDESGETDKFVKENVGHNSYVIPDNLDHIFPGMKLRKRRSKDL